MTANLTTPEIPDCSQSYFSNLANSTKYYGSLHVHIVLLICPLGLLTNLLTAITLNQQAMKSPTNILLTFLAVSDGIIMAFYIVFDVKFLRTGSLTRSTFSWAQYLLLYLFLQNIFHSFSSYLIVALAVFRLIYIRYPHEAVVFCTMKRAKYSILGIFLVSIFLSLPYISAHKVVVNESEETNQTRRVVFMVDYVSARLGTFIHVWNSIFVKTFPIISMTGLSLWLIIELRASERRRQKLKSDNLPSSIDKHSKAGANRRKSLTESTNRTIKATRIMLAIVFIFLLSYLPQATLLLLTGILGQCFSNNVYDNLGDVMDLMTLLNACTYFTLYCSMSKQFRDTFIIMFISDPWALICSRGRKPEDDQSSRFSLVSRNRQPTKNSKHAQCIPFSKMDPIVGE